MVATQLHELPGLDPDVASSLQAAGIATVEDLAHTDPRDGVPGVAAHDLSLALSRARSATGDLPSADLVGTRARGRREPTLVPLRATRDLVPPSPPALLRYMRRWWRNR